MEQVITPKVDAVEIESAEDIDFNSFALDERILKVQFSAFTPFLNLFDVCAS